MKRLKAKLAAVGLACLACLACTGIGAVILPATPASAMVLVNYPGTSVRVGHTFTVGDWFQQSSGGSRWFTTNVYSPTGARIFHEVGYAPSAHWDFWAIKATRTGTYRVMYEVRSRPGHDTYAWYTVKSHR
jgi:hypothetical protein